MKKMNKGMKSPIGKKNDSGDVMSSKSGPPNGAKMAKTMVKDKSKPVKK